MKKAITFVLSAGILLCLTACAGKIPGTASAGQEGGANGIPIQEDGGTGAGTGAEGGNGSAVGIGAEQGAGGSSDMASDSQPGGNGGLRILASGDVEGCHTKDGYYYQTFETEELSDGSYGSHLMYMDFAAGQEVYLCSNAGCSHNSPDCTSVLPYDDFQTASTLLFVWQDSLYLLSKMSDNDGSMQMTMDGEGYASQSDGIEGSEAVLYRAKLDGTGREKVYSFDPSLVLEDLVMGDGNGIYVAVKKMTAQQSDEGTYFNSTERKLVYLDLAAAKEQEICSLDFEGYISWRLKGCYGRTLVLEGTDYGREVSGAELFEDDAYRELYENSQEVYATLSIDHPELEIRYRRSNQYGNFELVDGNMLYASCDDGSVKAIDLSTGAEREICRRSGGSYLYRRIGNKLCCDSSFEDGTFDYIDIDTGEVSHSSLVNKSLGWSLEFRAVLDSDVLVIYDCDATSSGGGSYEINRWQYGLISQEDLFAGNDNYRKINMVGKGE
ncbi:MAG TPA: hypothetical protein DCZ91_23815 [Lachnospiraceae bacterium]|nr:hypothetical protein [Lachnospiraceae bacterium]